MRFHVKANTSSMDRQIVYDPNYRYAVIVGDSYLSLTNEEEVKDVKRRLLRNRVSALELDI